MSSCKTIEPLVTPYVDGELGEDDRRTIDEHLRACPPCHSRVDAERAVHDLLQARQPLLKTERAPESLRTACAQLAARHAADGIRPDAAAARVGPAITQPPAGASLWVTRMTPYALAASLVLVVGGAFVYQATDQSARVLAAQLTADHVKCFALNSALGTNQSASVVEGAMLSGFDWNVHLPANLASSGLELVGARPCLYSEGRVAHIMYRHAGTPVSLFMLPKTERTEQLVEVLGHEAAIWCVGNRTFVLIAREPKPQVQQLASFVRAELH